MNKQKGLAPILIILLIAAIVGGYLIYQKQFKPASVPQPSPSPITTPTVTNSVETANWKTYTNQTAKFSIQYPSSMTYTEESFSEKLKKLVFKGDKDTITINYALAGEKTAWGGGCDLKEHKKISFLNKQAEVCQGDDYLGQLYTSHPENIVKFQIQAQFSPINKEEILKILSTFKFTE